MKNISYQNTTTTNNATQPPEVTSPERHLRKTESEYLNHYGTCPYCQSDNTEDYGYVFRDEGAVNDFECYDCSRSWREVFCLVITAVILDTDEGEVELTSEGESSSVNSDGEQSLGEAPDESFSKKSLENIK